MAALTCGGSPGEKKFPQSVDSVSRRLINLQVCRSRRRAQNFGNWV